MYIPEALAKELRRRAKSQRKSLSRYLADVVKREVGGGWPDGFFEHVLGGWKGAPLERPAQGEFEARDAL